MVGKGLDPARAVVQVRTGAQGGRVGAALLVSGSSRVGAASAAASAHGGYPAEGRRRRTRECIERDEPREAPRPAARLIGVKE